MVFSPSTTHNVSHTFLPLTESTPSLPPATIQLLSKSKCRISLCWLLELIGFASSWLVKKILPSGSKWSPASVLTSTFPPGRTFAASTLWQGACKVLVTSLEGGGKVFFTLGDPDPQSLASFAASARFSRLGTCWRKNHTWI